MTTCKIEQAAIPEMLLGNLVMVEFYGEGYYSGNTESQAAFFEADDFEKIAEVFEGYTPYFSELDGKHSEVEGKVHTTHITTLGELKTCIATYEGSDDYYPVFETIGQVEEYEGLVDMLMETHEEIVSKFEVRTTVEYFVEGVKL